MFPVRWRWDAGRALAVPRFYGSRKVPPQIQRMRADDLLAAVFPAQVGCQENVTGPLEIPDHPLVHQAVLDCMHEAMDIGGLVDVLKRIEAGEVRLHAIDTLEPSPMAHEILSGKPYTYLDDAPLEERRTRAVTLRRALPESARELGSLDADAIARVREEAWPDPRDAEEAHDALLSLVVAPASELAAWAPLLEELVDGGRAATVRVRASGATPPPNPLPVDGEGGHHVGPEAPSLASVGPEALEGRGAMPSRVAQSESDTVDPLSASGEGAGGGVVVLYFAAENLNLVRFLYPDGRIEPAITPPEAALYRVEDRDEARSRMLRGWSEASGPILPSDLGPRLGLRPVDVERGLQQLEGLGHVLRGRFSPDAHSEGPAGPERVPVRYRVRG